MRFQLEIDSRNSAVADDPMEALRNGLLKVVGQIGAGGTAGLVYDQNGQGIGSWTYDAEEVAPDV